MQDYMFHLIYYFNLGLIFFTIVLSNEPWPTS